MDLCEAKMSSKGLITDSETLLISFSPRITEFQTLLAKITDSGSKSACQIEPRSVKVSTNPNFLIYSSSLSSPSSSSFQILPMCVCMLMYVRLQGAHNIELPHITCFKKLDLFDTY